MVEIPMGNGTTIKKEAIRHEGKEFENVDSKIHEEAVKASEERIGAAAEAFNKFHKAYATDFNLREEELIAAMYLEVLNWQEFYPDELGGKERFKEICDQTWKWFEKNKHQA